MSSMEVKDVTKAGVQEVLSLSPQGNAPSDQQDHAEKAVVSSEVLNQDIVDISDLSRREGQHEVVAKLNQTISTLNVAVEGTNQIEKLFGSIEGLVEQSETATPEQLKLLEAEGSNLVDAISGVALKKAENGKQPLAGDAIELQVERSLNKALSIILPDDAKHAFGLSGISFTPAENIMATRQAVARAKAQFAALQSHLDKAVESVKGSVSTIDVTLQNVEASRTSVRALQNAIELTSTTSDEIAKDPETALESIGTVSGVGLV